MSGSDKSMYVNIDEINDLQTEIMVFISKWVRENKVPIPQKKIIEEMKVNGVKEFTTVWSINALLKKGYIRRAYTISNKTSYVQLRTV